MSEGRPSAVRELTYDTDILPLSQDNHISPSVIDIACEVHKWTAKLTEHCNRFSTITSLCVSTDTRIDALTDLDVSLLGWRDQIPVAHQPGQDVATDWNSFILVAPLHLEYFNLVRAIHWACYMAITTSLDAIDDRYRRLLQTSNMRCLWAARSFVQTLNRFVLYARKVANPANNVPSIADGGTGRNLFPIACVLRPSAFLGLQFF